VPSAARPVMRLLTAPLALALALIFTTPPSKCGARAQPAAADRNGATANPATRPGDLPAPSFTSKDLQGLDVFASEGQLFGKIARVNVLPDGKVKEVEVVSHGFLGLFSKTYVVPTDKLHKKGGRVDLSLTSEQARRLAK
jgi:hypothetical protein